MKKTMLVLTLLVWSSCSNGFKSSDNASTQSSTDPGSDTFWKKATSSPFKLFPSTDKVEKFGFTNAGTSDGGPQVYFQTFANGFKFLGIANGGIRMEKTDKDGAVPDIEIYGGSDSTKRVFLGGASNEVLASGDITGGQIISSGDIRAPNGAIRAKKTILGSGSGACTAENEGEIKYIRFESPFIAGGVAPVVYICVITSTAPTFGWKAVQFIQ